MRLWGKLVCLFRAHTCAEDADRNWRTHATRRQCRRCGQWMKREEFYVGAKQTLQEVGGSEIISIREVAYRWVPMTDAERVAVTLMGEPEPNFDGEDYDSGGWMNWYGWAVLIFLSSGLVACIAGLLHSLGVL